jgi:polysaccharide deacetylase 2 family uncharacterized protein YibQ
MASAGQGIDGQRARSGLIAAYALVLALVAASALIAFGAGGSAPRAAEPTTTPAAEPETLPFRRGGSLKLPPKPPSAAFRTLPPAEVAGMVETTADGQRLPRISASGWMPWIANSRRFDPAGPTIRMGLLMIDIGGDELLTQRAVDDLPGEVSLAFLPSTPDLPRWLRRARERGHETYLMLPVEDPNGPAERGIKSIATSVDPSENLRRLTGAMARGEGYVGFVVRSPGPVSQSEAIARPLIKEIADRGLAVVEINPSPDTAILRGLTIELGVGYARSTSILDYKLAGGSLASALDRLVTWLGESGTERTPRHIFGVLQPSNEAIDAIVAWHARQATPPGFSLVPIIGHFECRHNCMTRLASQPAQLRP